MSVLNKAGCDILLLEYAGDAPYKTIDSSDTYSSELKIEGLTRFPEGFSLKTIQNDIREAINNERLYGVRPQKTNCTNAWLTGKIYDDIKLPAESRGNDGRFYYNMFVRVRGVEDRLTYTNELYRLQLELKNSKRNVLILNAPLPKPTTDEIAAIRRGSYQKLDQLIMDLSTNLLFARGQETQRQMIKVFVDLMLEEGKKEGSSLNRLTSKAVYLIVWLRRYGQQLFGGTGANPCVLMMGGCGNDDEAMFIRFLSRLPVDIMIFTPDLNTTCCLKDSLLFEVTNPNSLSVAKYPEEDGGVKAGTSAYHAERDLDSMMYQDSGIYRDMQYLKASVLTLETMREEIGILWDTELKFRPNFSTVDDTVNMPVLFAKIDGIKDGDVTGYWGDIKKLLTPETQLITKVPNLQSTDQNELKPFAAEFFKNGRLQKRAIKASKHYKFSFLREPMQDYLLDKLQQVIDRRLIKGTFENGTEYTIVSTCLNLDIATLRKLQSFDFTKKNPKLIYVITGETALSLEDTIYAVFLNQVGFDVLFFVPTGYRCVKNHYAGSALTEHQAGQPVYDLQVPDFAEVRPRGDKTGFWQKLLNRR